MDQGQGEDGRPKIVLLIEDHEDSAELMTLFLENEGYAVRWVNTARGALALFAQEAPFDRVKNPRPDVILLDLTLPDSDGLEVGRRLKQSVPNVPPIIIMSAKSATAVAQAARTIGAAGFVRKPFATETLVASIKNALDGGPLPNRDPA